MSESGTGARDSCAGGRAGARETGGPITVRSKLNRFEHLCRRGGGVTCMVRSNARRKDNCHTGPLPFGQND